MIISSYRATKISGGIARREAARHPISIQAAITDKCFNQCDFCDHWRRDSHKTIDVVDWVEYLQFAMANGLESVCYAGGDALAHRDINAIMKFHISADLPFGFITTGYVPKTVDADLLSKARWVRCSLDAIKPDVYAKVRGGVPVDKVISSIRMMVDNGVPVEVYAAIQMENFNEIPFVYRFCKSLGMNVVFTMAEDGTCNTDIPTISQVDYPGACIDPRLLGEESGIGHGYEQCYAAKMQCYVDSSGDVYPCCHLSGDNKLKPYTKPIGNISEPWDIHDGGVDFYNRKFFDRPKRCNVCTSRFKSINTIAKRMFDGRKDFF